MLVSVCRGHEGEVTDLSVSGDDSLVASSSNDHSIRCWSLQVRLSNCCSRWVGDEVGLVQNTWVRVTPLVFLRLQGSQMRCTAGRSVLQLSRWMAWK